MNQQTCNPYRLDAFLQSELSQTEEQQFTLHLDECADCREELECRAAERSAWQEATDLLGGVGQLSIRAIGDHRTGLDRSPRIEQVLNQLAPTDDPDMLGRIGGYEVSGVVGAGGMGVVLKAHDPSLDRIVAIKVMAPHLASSGSARKRFAREAKAAAAVLHPNVIAIHGVASDDACPYLVMPYVRGASLQKRIESQGPLPLKDTLRIGAQIAAGLAAAHEQGLVHRDIKPANILLEEGVERVTITDFGLARAIDDASLTSSGVIAGTPRYMSPEQTRGEAIDARSDLFSLGSVLYAMCAGRSPFRSETTYGVLHRIANDSPTPLCEVNSDVPVWLGHIIERLMAKRPDDRFDSAAQVAELLENCLAHVQQPTTIPLPESVASLARKQRRPPIGKLIVAAAFAFSLIFAGVLIVLELNKGTLTIESDADDVPIRIMQGDEVVKEMTVSKGKESTRIAAGRYVVEIDGRFDGITLNDKVVSLKRGDDVTVRIVRTNDPGAVKKSDPETASGTLKRSPGSAPKLGELVSLRLIGDVAGKYAESVRTLRNGQAVDDLEIEVLATVVERLSDGRLRIEHQSPPRVVFTEYKITLLMATVDPSAISRETNPQGTKTSDSPDAAIESLTAEATHSYRLTLSDLDDVVLKNFRLPLPPKAAALSELQFKRTAHALVRLLELNGDGTTHIEKLGFPTNFAGIKDVEEMRSAGKDYVAVVARRFPPEVEQPFGKSGYGIIFLFDKAGNLAAKFGGNLGPDGVNGEDVQLLTLGTENQWFAVVHQSQPNSTFKKMQKVFLIEDRFPLAFQIHAVESMAWTGAPDRAHDFGFQHFFNPKGMPNREFGTGHDGKDYYPILGWDERKRVFRGPSQLTYKDKLLFHVRLDVSERFQPVDKADNVEKADNGPLVPRKESDKISAAADSAFYVVGLVQKPDKYAFPVGREIRLLDAIAMAGGPTSEVADTVVLSRSIPGQNDRVVIRSSLQKAKRSVEANLLLAPGDVLALEPGFPSDAVLQEMHDLLAEETRLDVKLRYEQQFLEGGKLFSETDSSQRAESSREKKRIEDRQQEIADRRRVIHENELGDLRKVAENAGLECSEEPMYGQSSYGVIVYATTLVPIQKDELLLFHAGALYRSKGTLRPLRTTGQGFFLRPNIGIPSGSSIALACIQDSEEERKNVENGYMPDSDRARNPSRAYRANVFDRQSGQPIRGLVPPG